MTRSHPHPGEILRKDVFEPLRIELGAAARCLGVSRSALSRLVSGRTRLSADMAVRLECAGVSTAKFWVALQSNYDLGQAMMRRRPPIRRLIAQDVPLRRLPDVEEA